MATKKQTQVPKLVEVHVLRKCFIGNTIRKPGDRFKIDQSQVDGSVIIAVSDLKARKKPERPLPIPGQVPTPSKNKGTFVEAMQRMGDEAEAIGGPRTPEPDEAVEPEMDKANKDD